MSEGKVNLLCLRSSSCTRLCRASLSTLASWRSEVTLRQWRFSSDALLRDCSSWACSVATYTHTHTHRWCCLKVTLPALPCTSARPVSPWRRAAVCSASPSPASPPSASGVCGRTPPRSGSSPAAWPARPLNDGTLGHQFVLSLSSLKLCPVRSRRFS